MVKKLVLAPCHDRQRDKINSYSTQVHGVETLRVIVGHCLATKNYCLPPAVILVSLLTAVCIWSSKGDSHLLAKSNCCPPKGPHTAKKVVNTIKRSPLSTAVEVRRPSHSSCPPTDRYGKRAVATTKRPLSLSNSIAPSRRKLS